MSLTSPGEDNHLGTSTGSPKLAPTIWDGTVFSINIAQEIFSQQLRANHHRQLCAAINQFPWSDRIKQRHKYISTQDRRVCTHVALCGLLLSADRKINGISEPIVFLASFQLFFFSLFYFFFFTVPRCVSTPSFLFNNFSAKCHPLPEQHATFAMEPTPVIASPLDISAEFMGLDLFSSNQTSGSCAQALTLGGKHRNP